LKKHLQNFCPVACARIYEKDIMIYHSAMRGELWEKETQQPAEEKRDKPARPNGP